MTHESKAKLINAAFLRDQKKFRQQSAIRLKASISEGTLLYSWGSAARGKLGLSARLKTLKAHSQFRQRLGGNSNDGTNAIETYTMVPQPIVALLGTKIKQVAVGMEHCLALSTDEVVYAWGDN